MGIGEQVTDQQFKLGDRVAFLALHGCGLDTCTECSRDIPQLCLSGTHHGIGQDGFYDEYFAVDVRAAIPLPDGISPDVAAVTKDAVKTAYHGITRRAEVRFMGKHQTFKMHSKSASLFFLCLGNLLANRSVRPEGKILCVGTLDRTNELDMKIGIRKRLSIIFTYGGQQSDLVKVLDLIAKGVIQPQVKLGKLQDFPKALKDLGHDKVKDWIALVPVLVSDRV